MIDDNLNRDSLIRLALAVVSRMSEQELASGEDERAIREALAALANSFATHPRLGDAVDAESRSAFIPTDAPFSLVQASIEEDLHTLRGAVVQRDKAGPLASERRAEVRGREEGADPFENLDPRWVIKFVGTLARYLRKRRDFKLPSSPPKTFELECNARVVLVGDWGTGEQMASLVAKQVEVALRDAGDRQVHVIHLGDVYYAGTKWEAEHRFLPHWPVEVGDGQQHRSWCLNANHDMYAAGEGLFEVILRDERFAAQRTRDGEPTSEFRLLGEHWQILGLDTAWKLTGWGLGDLRGHAGHIGDEQVEWLTRSASEGPPTVLLSHHQPFSRKRPGHAGLEREGNLFEKTASLRETPGLAAWFWGHEHRCMTYGTRDGVGYAACVGHGAVPSAARPSTADAGEWELTDSWRDVDGEKWRNCGFAILDFSPEAVEVRYVDYQGELSRAPDHFGRPRRLTAARSSGQPPT